MVFELTFVFTRVANEIGDGKFPSEVYLFASVTAAARIAAVLVLFCTVITSFIVLRQQYANGFIHTAFSLGIGYRNIYKALVFFVAPLALFQLFLTFEVIPMAEKMRIDLKHGFRNNIDFVSMPLGRMMKLNENTVLFIRETDDEDMMKDVFLARVTEGGNVELETARFATLSSSNGEQRFDFLDGEIFQRYPANKRLSISQYKKHSIMIHGKSKNISSSHENIKTKSTYQLLQFPYDEKLTEISFRVSIAWIMIVMVLYSEYFSRSLVRNKPTEGIWMWFVFFMFYAGAIFVLTSRVSLSASKTLPIIFVVHFIATLPLIIMFMKNHFLKRCCENVMMRIAGNKY